MGSGVYSPGTKYGMIPGSNLGKSPFDTSLGGLYGAIAPPTAEDQAIRNNMVPWWEQAQDRDTARNRAAGEYSNKQDLWKSIMGGTQGYNSSNSSASSYGNMIPAPQYASTAPIWSQQQINNQANSQRAQMQAQAANSVRGYATGAAQRGFSPMSPLTAFLQQTAGQRANIGAAQNETSLNWNAAEGNRAAQQRGEGINAGLYGSYASALARARDQQLQSQSMGFNQDMERNRLLASLIGRG